jgi:hydroxymethylglutaryl-CoA reductase
MSDGSRIPGFYKLPIALRRQSVAERSGLAEAELAEAVATGGLTTETADKVVENVIGTYALPFGIALNVRVNGKDYLVPMVVEEPSVIAAASNAARMVRAGGGFVAEMVDPLMIGQIEIYAVPEPDVAALRVIEAGAELVERAGEYVPALCRLGGGPRRIEVRRLGEDRIVVHVLVDCRDAMGANMVNTIAEGLAPRVKELTGGEIGLRILSNLADQRCVRVTCRVRAEALASRSDADSHKTGDEAIDRIVQASRFADLDPYRAATHNKGIMNGLDAVVLATGNDFRAVEAGAHAYAARSGCYRPLSTFRREADELVGTLELPLALGTVGGTLRVHPGARLALRILGVESASELAMVAASVGLSSNLAALRALATEGIQRGHMSLHARSVAATAGASGAEVEAIADKLVANRDITVEAAARELALHRGGRS